MFKIDLANGFNVKSAATTTRKSDFIEGRAALRVLSGGKVRFNQTAQAAGFGTAKWVTPYIVKAGDVTHYVLAVTANQQEPKSNSFAIKGDHKVASSRLANQIAEQFNTGIANPFVEIVQLDAEQAKALTRSEVAFVLQASNERLSDEEVARIEKLIASRPENSFGNATPANETVTAATQSETVVAEVVNNVPEAPIVGDDDDDLEF